MTVVLDEPHIVGGAASGGAVMAAAGVLLGAAARNPTIATSAFLFVWNVLELLLIPAGDPPVLPFGLVSSLMGGADNVLVLAAMSLLLAYLAVLALAVGKWALPRDLT